jgi:hypothetical protein
VLRETPLNAVGDGIAVIVGVEAYEQREWPRRLEGDDAA